MALETKPHTAHKPLQQARFAYYELGDDKTCARLLWEAVFSSFQLLAQQMGHPCEDPDQAKKFARRLECEYGNEYRLSETRLHFGFGMLDHAEDGEWSQDPEFAWTFPEFPMVIREVTRIVDTLTAQAEAVKS